MKKLSRRISQKVLALVCLVLTMIGMTTVTASAYKVTYTGNFYYLSLTNGWSASTSTKLKTTDSYMPVCADSAAYPVYITPYMSADTAKTFTSVSGPRVYFTQGDEYWLTNYVYENRNTFPYAYLYVESADNPGVTYSVKIGWYADI